MIDKTTRVQSIAQPRIVSDVVFNVGFELENKSELQVYKPNGELAIDGVDYNVTSYGLPAATTNTIVVTWIGTTPVGTFVFYRNSTTTQGLDITGGFATGDIETALDRLHLAGQNSIRTSSNVLSLAGRTITRVGEPIDENDASTVQYAQEVYSKKGYICPPERPL